MNFTIIYFGLNKGRNKILLPPGAEILCLAEDSGRYGSDFEMAVKICEDPLSKGLCRRIFEVIYAFKHFEVPNRETYIYKDKITHSTKGTAAFLFEVVTWGE